MEKMQLTTIHWKEDYKNKLTDRIHEEKQAVKYLKHLINYFEKENITIYNKFDKRDFNKIEDYLKDKKMIYYKDCTDNFYVGYKDSVVGRDLYIYVNNKQQYNCDINIYDKHLDDSLTFNNVLEQAKNRLNYVETKLKEDENILKHFDVYFQRFNDKVKDFHDFIEKTKINNIIDIYIYANYKD